MYNTHIVISLDIPILIAITQLSGGYYTYVILTKYICKDYFQIGSHSKVPGRGEV